MTQYAHEDCSYKALVIEMNKGFRFLAARAMMVRYIVLAQSIWTNAFIYRQIAFSIS